MNKINKFFDKNTNLKYFKIVEIIFVLMFFISALIFFITKEIIYEGIGLTSLFLAFLLGIIFAINNYKKELLYGVYIFIMVFSVLSLQGYLAKLMYKYTSINTEFWLNSISVIIASLISAGVAGYISYLIVLKQIKYNKEALEKQIKSSNEALKKQIDENKRLTTHAFEESRNEKNNVAMNYIYLLNTEFVVHKEIYVTYIYYKTYSTINKNKLNIIFNRYNAKMWNSVKVECAKYLPNELMEELIGYYYGVETFKEIEYIEKADIIKNQLVHMYKCISIIKTNFPKPFREVEVFEIDGNKVSLDKLNGELIIE